MSAIARFRDLDEASISRGAADQEHERQIAIYDLIDENCFALPAATRSLWLKIALQTPNLFGNR